MEYISVTIHTTTEAADIVSLILIEEGSEGTSVVDRADLEFVKQNVYWDYAPEILPAQVEAESVLVSGFFELNKDLTFLKKRLEELKNQGELDAGSLAIEVKGLKSEDYENEWKKYYNIMEFSALAIVPEWLTYSGDKPWLSMNPGKAFGTGGHETTAMCLELMQGFDLNGVTVLDVGCGSGILGLAALRMGAGRAILTDIDAQAVEAARENAAKNSLTEKAEIYLADLLSEEISDGLKTEKADIVLANLTADILIRLAPRLKSLVKAGGKIVVSGIINSRLLDVESAFKGFKAERKLVKGEWTALLYSI